MSHYYQADMLCVPSISEALPTVVLEAMLCGAPVIASNTTSLPEVLGREDWLFDPFDVNSICGKITEVLTNEDLKKDLAKYGLEQS